MTMTFTTLHNIGIHIKTAIGVVPQQFSGTTAATGSAIATQGYLSCSIAAVTGATSGTPDSFTLITTVEDSADGSTGWAAYKPDNVTAVTNTLTAASTVAEINVDLGNSRGYIRVVQTPAFVNGTTPKVFGAANIVLASNSIPV